MKEDKAVLKIKHIKFINLGTRVCPPRKYLTIDLLDNWKIIDKINRWLKDNNVNEGVTCLPYRRQSYRDDELMLKYRFGIDRHTKIVDSKGKKMPKNSLKTGCDIGIIARVYPGTHWHGLGVKRLVEKIIIQDNNKS